MPARADYGILYEDTFGVCPEVSVTAELPEYVSVVVKDRITGKLIEGALVRVNETDVTTDVSGLAEFKELPPGEYVISVSASGYKTTTKKGEFTFTTIALWPLWSIGLGIVGTAAIGVVVIERLSRPKR